VAKAKKPQRDNTVRIIGGELRGRKLTFPDIESLRPSTDRIRETVFNWLQNDVPGARCLDLFCGSGALGYEALSRGARSVFFVDEEKRVCDQIRANNALLKADNAEIFCGTAQQFLAQAPAAEFDVVFLDPPFQRDMLQGICEKLVQSNCLAHKSALVYLEAEFPLEDLSLPDEWRLVRSKKAGAVYYGLVRVARN
jgi:16S rRNA (guanine966-N2)-methyltransferase